MRVHRVLGVVVLAACGQVPSSRPTKVPDTVVTAPVPQEPTQKVTTPQEPAQTPQQPGPATVVEEAVSGTRLKAVYTTAVDGLKTPTGIYDSALGVKCLLRQADDGKTRCLPVAGMESTRYYPTSACSDAGPWYQRVEKCAARPVYTLSYTEQCGNYAFSVGHVDSVQAIGVVYAKTGDTCAAVDLSSLAATYELLVLSAVPASEFAEVSETHD